MAQKCRSGRYIIHGRGQRPALRKVSAVRPAGCPLVAAEVAQHALRVSNKRGVAYALVADAARPLAGHANAPAREKHVNLRAPDESLHGLAGCPG